MNPFTDGASSSGSASSPVFDTKSLPTSFPGVDAGTLGLLGASLLGGADDFWSSSSIAVKDPLTGDTLLQTPLLQDDPEPGVVDAASLFGGTSGADEDALGGSSRVVDSLSAPDPLNSPLSPPRGPVSSLELQRATSPTLGMPGTAASALERQRRELDAVPPISASERIEHFDNDDYEFFHRDSSTYQVGGDRDDVNSA